jgi:hypothetical protein
MDSITENTLRSVNFLRKHFGYEPLPSLPRGIKDHPCKCPLARSLPFVVEVSNNHFIFHDFHTADKCAAALGVNVYGNGEMWLVPMPSHMRKFVSRFDRGYYPELKD